MAAASALFLASAFLLSLLLCFYSSLVYGENQSFRVVRVDTFVPAAVCSTSKASGGNSLKIAHVRGPCSPISGSKPNYSETLRQDLLRVESLRTRLASKASSSQGDHDDQARAWTTSEVSLPARRGSAFGSGNYVVTVGYGTPKKDQTVIFDTGSDVCWIQCRPCAGSCYQQQDPVFDPSGSSSYRNITCSSATCGNLKIRGCSGGTCLYGVRYGDNSSTIGFLGLDSLTLTPADVFPNFVFGCGQRNQGLFGKTAGLIGLGRNSYSLVSQTAQKLGDVFSYCLPASSSSTGDLTIGKSTAAASAKYTPMLTDTRATSLYFLSLTGISVGGQLLPISSTVFSSAGTLIDSGTVITRLPPSAYDALRSAFRRAMSQYPTAPPFSLLDTCFDFSKSQNITYPPITLHFNGGVDVGLESPGIFSGPSVSQICLAFAENGNPSDPGIIGNIQQRTLEVVYDIGAKKIGFAPGACS